MMDVGFTPGGQRRYSYYLRPIGAYLDMLDVRSVTIAEIEDGFVWHCYKRTAPLEQVSGVFAFSETVDLIESSAAKRPWPETVRPSASLADRAGCFDVERLIRRRRRIRYFPSATR